MCVRFGGEIIHKIGVCVTIRIRRMKGKKEGVMGVDAVDRQKDKGCQSDTLTWV